MMDTFDFPFHQVAEDNPPPGDSVKFGRSYEFTSGPVSPLSRMFTLTMMGMKVYVNTNGTIDSTTNTHKDNMKVFYAFWQAHYCHIPFIYVHPFHGSMLVRFMTPLKLPTPIIGGSGIYPDFQIQFVEKP